MAHRTHTHIPDLCSATSEIEADSDAKNAQLTRDFCFPKYNFTDIVMGTEVESLERATGLAVQNFSKTHQSIIAASIIHF